MIENKTYDFTRQEEYTAEKIVPLSPRRRRLRRWLRNLEALLTRVAVSNAEMSSFDYPELWTQYGQDVEKAKPRGKSSR
jgi:hypothetical protein